MRRAMLLFPGDKGFNPALEDAAFEENTALAPEALDSDIGPEPDYLPFVAAAGVFLLEADDVTQPYLHDHLFTLKRYRQVMVNLLAEFGGSTPCCRGEVLSRRGIYNLP